MVQMAGHIQILHVDETLLAVSKPAGLRTIADGYDPTLPFLVEMLDQEFGRLWVVHRLDKDTSGVVVFARNADAHRDLNRQFAAREVHKVYLALANGSPGWDARLVDSPLRVNGDRRHRTVVDHQSGKAAGTRLEVAERFAAGFTLFQAAPLTGYTHQIRAHCASVAHPIYADFLYGFPRAGLLDAIPLNRLGLHARSLAFSHPLTGDPMTIEAPLPGDLSAALELLRE